MRAMNENTRKLDVRIPMTANIASMPTKTIFDGFMFSQYEKGGVWLEFEWKLLL